MTENLSKLNWQARNGLNPMAFALTKTMALFLVVALTLALTACSKPTFFATELNGSRFGNTLELLDVKGEMRNLKDFQGKVVALFFGYTSCPDFCPTELGKLAAIKKQLAQNKNDKKFQVVFVTIDPERDTATAVANYLQQWDSTFVGLLPKDQNEVKAIAEHFHIYVAKQPQQEEVKKDGKKGNQGEPA